MSHGNDIDRIKTHRHVQRWSSTLGRLANEDLYCRCSLARTCFGIAIRKLPVNKPSRTDQARRSEPLAGRGCKQTANGDSRKHAIAVAAILSAPRTKSDQRVDLVFLEFLPEWRHVAAHVAAVHDRIEDPFVADVACHSASVRSRAWLYLPFEVFAFHRCRDKRRNSVDITALRDAPNWGGARPWQTRRRR